MKRLSDGSPSTLGTYLKYAEFFGPKAVGFIQKKIAESPKGEHEEVLADEGQMIQVLMSLARS